MSYKKIALIITVGKVHTAYSVLKVETLLSYTRFYLLWLKILGLFLEKSIFFLRKMQCVCSGFYAMQISFKYFYGTKALDFMA